MENIYDTSTPEVGTDELAIAKQEAENSETTFTHKFKTPFQYNNKSYEELRFDFESLTGRDSLSIETELQALGIAVVVPAFSGPYMVRIAAKACTEPLGADAFETMRLSDYNRIRSAVRSFILASE